MSDKLEIMRRLTTLLEATPGYDLTGRVFRGRKTIAASEVQGAAMSIMESPRPTIGQEAGVNGVYRREDWTLNVQGWPVDDPDHPSDPAYLMADAVEQQLGRVIATHPVNGMGGGGDALHPEDYLLGGLITKMTIAGTAVLPAQENLSRFAFFYIPVVLSIVKSTRS